METSSISSKFVNSVGKCIPPKKVGKKSCCINLEKPPEKPDPAIYTQQEVISQGLMPSWDNPDIITNNLDPWSLYKEPEVTIRNLSSTAPAINVQITLSYAQFGIGFQKIPVATQLINLAAGGMQKVKFPLTQAIADGPPYISSWVNIIHSADKRLSNNEGLQTIYGAKTSDVGRNPSFTFPVFNNSGVVKNVSLVIYANELSATLSHTTFQLAAFEQRMITIHLHVPPGLHGASLENLYKDVTVAAFIQGGVLLGGLTYIIKIDN